MWKRLSSLQRSLICLVLLLGGLSAIYIIPNLRGSHSTDTELLPGIKRLKHDMEMDPIEKQKLDKEKKEFIANLKRKHAIQQISDIMVSLCNVLSLYSSVNR